MNCLLLLLVVFSAKADENCDDDIQLEQTGKSTKFRIIDPCTHEFLRVSMDSLYEMQPGQDPDPDTEAGNEVISFAASTQWSWKEDNPEAKEDCTGVNFGDGKCIHNQFNATGLKLTGKRSAGMLLDTIFAVDEIAVPHPDGQSPAIVVPENSVKLSVEIYDWPYQNSDNYLVLCVRAETNDGDDDGNDDTIIEGRQRRRMPISGTAEIESLDSFTCVDPDDDNEVSTQSVTIQDDLEGNGVICYAFEGCNGNVEYDPIYTLLRGANKGNTFAFYVVFVVVTMSFLSV